MQSAISRPEPNGDTRLGWPLRAFYFAIFGALGSYSPYFPLWLEAHGFRGLDMSLIAALAPAMSALGPPLIGILADRSGGRGWLLTLGAVSGLVSMLGLALAEALERATLFVIVFAAVLLFALSRTALIMLADVLALEAGSGYGRRRLWGSLGYMLAASVVGWALKDAGLNLLPAIVALPLFLALAVSLMLPRALPATRKGPLLPDLGTLLSDRVFLGFLVCSALTWAAHSSYDLCSSLFFRDLGAPKNTIGLLWGLGILVEIVLMANAEPLFRKLSSTRLLVVAYAGGALRWFGMAQLTSVTAAFVLQPLHALSFGLMWLASLEYLRRWSARGLLASAQGIFMAAVALGSVAGILAWGPLYERNGGPTVFAYAGAIALLTAFIAAASLRRDSP